MIIGRKGYWCVVVSHSPADADFAKNSKSFKISCYKGLILNSCVYETNRLVKTACMQMLQGLPVVHHTHDPEATDTFSSAVHFHCHLTASIYTLTLSHIIQWFFLSSSLHTLNHFFSSTSWHWNFRSFLSYRLQISRVIKHYNGYLLLRGNVKR